HDVRPDRRHDPHLPTPPPVQGSVTDCDPLQWVLGISRGPGKKILMAGAAIAGAALVRAWLPEPARGGRASAEFAIGYPSHSSEPSAHPRESGAGITRFEPGRTPLTFQREKHGRRHLEHRRVGGATGLHRQAWSNRRTGCPRSEEAQSEL